MDSPITPLTPSGCNFFENYGLDYKSYNMHYSMASSALQPEEVHRDICIRKCESVWPILKDNWMDLIFKVNFPSLIALDKLVSVYNLQQLTDILAQGDLLPEEREEIKKMRCKARNNRAAKSLRQKHKEQDMQIFEDVEILIKHKNQLMKEANDLKKEISQYKAKMRIYRN